MSNTSSVDRMFQDATDWDDFINEEIVVSEPKPRKPKFIKDVDEESETDKLQTVKQKIPEKEKAEKSGVSADPLMKDAREKLNYYLKKIPSYTTLSSQIAILNVEMNNYKKNGDSVNQEACKEMLVKLQEKIKEIKSIFSPIEGEKAKAKRLENLAQIKASTVIKDLMSKEKEIKKSIAANSVNKIVQNISQLRKMLKFAENDNQIIDFDDFIIENKNSEIFKNYEAAMSHVSEVTGLDLNELYEMPISHIRDFLKDNTGEEFYNEELKVVRAQIQSEKDNISGALTLSNIIANLYDIKNSDQDVTAVKEIIASAHISMVKSTAYSICTQNGGMKSMQYYDDCVSAGLLALTGAINDWIKLQQAYPVSLSFKGWARVNITNAVKRELLSQQSGGRVSGSRMADMVTRENKKISSFLENFPQYKEFDKDFVRELVNSIDVTENGLRTASTNDIKAIVSESEIEAGAEDGNGADMWANVNAEEFSDIVEAKSEYTALISSISELMSTMTKYEKKLFMMYFGFEKKLERDDEGKKTVSNKYTQAEIGVELYDYYLANGAKPKALNGAFSQPAIYDKIKKLEKHIANSINTNPKLKLGFDYLFIYWTQNSQLLEVMSNNREEIGMKLERDVLREYYKDDQEVSSIQLSDGKRLSDIFDISSSNPLDSDIEDFYKEAGV